jgi:hypothetical protein
VVEENLIGEPGALSMLGTVHLRSAILAARGGRVTPAWDLVSRALEVAGRVGRDTEDYGLLFGPAKVHFITLSNPSWRLLHALWPPTARIAAGGCACGDCAPLSGRGLAACLP